MRKVLIFLFFGSIQFNAMSQYQALHGSNYSGIMGIHNNPASALSHPKNWDINLMGLELGSSTNLIYLERYAMDGKQKQLLPFLKNGLSAKNLNTDIHLNILNARCKLNNRLAIGFGLNLRSYVQGTSSKYDFQDSLSDFNDFMLINESNQPMQASLLSSNWAEAFMGFSLNLLNSKKWIWNLGATLKLNKGLSGIYTKLENLRFNRIITNAPISQLNDIELKYNYSSNMDKWDPGTNPLTNMKNLFLNGEAGVGIDLGTEIFLKDQNNQELFESKIQYNYTWKLGVSILDLGYAEYANGLLNVNASGLSRNLTNSDLGRKFDSTITDLNRFDDSLRTTVSNFSRESFSDKFRIFHPTRIVLNIDRPITDLIGINAELSLPVSVFSSSNQMQLKSLTRFSVTPRIEDDKHGAYLPLTLNSNGVFLMGAAIRSGSLLLGIHNIIPFFQKMPYPNGGGYLAYVISPSEKLKRPKRKNVKCPD